MALYQQIYMLDKPVIARVQGHAIAGGCGLATVCDFVLAVPEANFGYTEVRIGFIPAIVMAFLLQNFRQSCQRIAADRKTDPCRNGAAIRTCQ